MTAAENAPATPLAVEWQVTRETLVGEGLWRYLPVINVDRVADIPADWPGAMGVPIGFMERWDRDRFEVLGRGHHLVIEGGRRPYQRVMVRNLRPDVPDVMTLALCDRGAARCRCPLCGRHCPECGNDSQMDREIERGEACMSEPVMTCEQHVLAELEELQAENESLRSRVSELEQAAAEADAKRAESPDGEIEPHEVQIVKLNEPFETAYLTVKDAWDFRNRENGLGLTADEAREKAASEDGLREVARIKVGWSREEAVLVETRIWPCQLRTGTQTFVMDMYDGGKSMIGKRVQKDSEAACRGRYFPAHRAQELESLGFEMLKKNLLDYADKLDAEAAKSDGEE
ncbi:MAG: hypothetical protein E7001_02960 [Coriobacteriaceae bacterium]|nr:hypothetical protein [Coriobacteriaceae bacterium]